MPSLVPGFEYDVFISYRQKDNKYDGWVSEFVANLKKDLEATFKEDVSVYFDENPHDGLLDTHDVNDSLRRKLKCAVFIPVISQTYCDQESFAWKNEFLAFKNFAAEGPHPIKITLPNGNVASRILPVRIHQLDETDRALLENEIGPIRAVDFIFNSPGVNRPLRSGDPADKHLDKTVYRDQINKTANAIKDILYGLRLGGPVSKVSVRPEAVQEAVMQKSIVVLPFVNMSSEVEQEYFSDGLTEEIITDLSHVHDLLVISRSSAMTFKNSTKKISEIANELNVHYVLEGSVRKAGSNLKITAQLIDGVKDIHLWARKFNGSLDDVFDIQEEVSRAIVDELKIKLTTKEEHEIGKRAFENVDAFELYLLARRELMKFNVEAFDRAKEFMHKALEITGPNETLFAGLAYVHFSYANIGYQADENWRRSREFALKTFEMDSESADANFVKGIINATYDGDLKEARRNLEITYATRPNDFDLLLWLCVTYLGLGLLTEGHALSERLSRVDPLSSARHAMPGVLAMYEGKFNVAVQLTKKAWEMEPENVAWRLFLLLSMAQAGKKEEVMTFVDKNIDKNSANAFDQTCLFLVYAFKGDNIACAERLKDPDFIAVIRKDWQYSHILAELCSLAGLINESLYWLENSVSRGFINHHYMSRSKLFENVRSNPRFIELLKKVEEERKKLA